MQPPKITWWFAANRLDPSGEAVWNKHNIALGGEQIRSFHAQGIDTIATVQIHHRAAKRACRRFGQQRNRLCDFHLPQGTVEPRVDSPLVEGSHHFGVDRGLGTGLQYASEQRCGEQAKPAAHGRRGSWSGPKARSVSDCLNAGSWQGKATSVSRKDFSI